MRQRTPKVQPSLFAMRPVSCAGLQ
jgi:hypothetical protein